MTVGPAAEAMSLETGVPAEVIQKAISEAPSGQFKAFVVRAMAEWLRSKRASE